MFASFIKKAQKWSRQLKKHVISTSGSTPDQSWDRVRSGQSYLYKTQGMDSEVFEIRLKDRVPGSDLTRAIGFALKRFPYMNTRLVELDGDFYIVQNPVKMTAQPGKRLAKLGSHSANQHLVDVTYDDRTIFFAFHHALCDGRGIQPFIETTIYYYCRLVYKSQASSEGIRLKDDSLLPGETEDAFWHYFEVDETKDFPNFSRQAFELPESHPNDEETEYRYELVISQEEFMQIAKANKATPVTQLSYALSKAISQLNPNLTQTINANIATDMRAALGYPNTYKNTVKSMILPYRPEDREKSYQEVASLYRGYLQQQKDPDFCKKEANNMVALYEKLDYTQGFKAKQELLSFMEHIKLDTFSISYVGQFVFNENEQYIDSMHLYGSGNIGVAIHMICAAGNFFIDIKQNFKEDTYVQALLQELAELGLQNVQLTGPIAFSTPKDGLPK